jgi:hypothetical protein
MGQLPVFLAASALLHAPDQEKPFFDQILIATMQALL